MSKPTKKPQTASVTPSRRDRLRPLELVGFSGVLAVFAGLVVLFVLRTTDGVADFATAGIVAGIAFIVTLMMVALVGLGGSPSEEDQIARQDLKTGDSKENWH